MFSHTTTSLQSIISIVKDEATIAWIAHQWSNYNCSVNFLQLIDSLLELAIEQIDFNLLNTCVSYYVEPSDSETYAGTFEIESYFAIVLCPISRTITLAYITQDQTIFSPIFSLRLLEQTHLSHQKVFNHLDSPNYSMVADPDIDERYGFEMIEHLAEHKRYTPDIHQNFKRGVLPLNPY